MNELVIVGNGPSLLGRGLGNQIDEFSEIVRFNGYILDGHQSDVGSRTTIWSRTYRLPEIRPMESLRQIWINMPLHERTVEKTALAFELVGPFASKSEIVPHPAAARALQDATYGLAVHDCWPSSGLLAIAHALDVGYSEVFVAGMDAWASEPYHYYEIHDRSGSHHRAAVEAAYLRKLLSASLISAL